MLQAPVNETKSENGQTKRSLTPLPERERYPLSVETPGHQSPVGNGSGLTLQPATAQYRSHVGSLQRMYGNQAVLQMQNGPRGQLHPLTPLRPSQSGLLQRKCDCGARTSSLSDACEECSKKPLQAKLAIGASNDPLEQEADRVADQVLAAPANAAVSGASPHIQRFTGQSTGQADAAPASVDGVLASPGSPLEPTLQQDMEQRFGHDFSRVRVHSGASAEQSARDVNANAYTVGNDIVFGRGRFAPATHEGRRLIAHELTHVVQQSGADGIRSSQSDEKRSLSPISTTSNERVQRFSVTNEPAGGCGICYDVLYPGLGPPNAGRVAHTVVQHAFLVDLSLLGSYRFVEFPFSAPGDENGRLDLAVATPTGFAIGEIKPATPNGERDGLRDLMWYKTAVENAYPGSTVDRLIASISVGGGLPMPDILATAAGCPEQLLGVVMTQPGLFGYFCQPPFSTARRTCSCLPPERERQRERQSVPATVPAPQPQPVPVPRRQPQGGSQPVPEPVPTPAPAPAPAPTPQPTPTPEGGGGEVIQFPGRPTPPKEVPAAAKSAAEQILDFIKKVIEGGLDVEQAVSDFLQRNPQVLDNLKLAVAAIIAGTIASDILSLGTAITKDPLVAAILAALIRIGSLLRAAATAPLR